MTNPVKPRKIKRIYRKEFYSDKRGFVYATRADITDYKTLSADEFGSFVQKYKTKAVRRMETFLKESKRMDEKITMCFDKLRDVGVVYSGSEMTPEMLQRLTVPQKRPKAIKFLLNFEKDGEKLMGNLLISPASVKLFVSSPSIDFNLPLYSITFYRNLIFKDNMLVALVKGTRVDPSRYELDEVAF